MKKFAGKAHSYIIGQSQACQFYKVAEMVGYNNLPIKCYKSVKGGVFCPLGSQLFGNSCHITFTACLSCPEVAEQISYCNFK